MRRPYLVSNPENPKWVCTLCFPNMIEIGRAYNYWIVYDKHVNGRPHTEPYKNGKYAILDGQGHGGDELLFFKKKPIWNAKTDINADGSWNDPIDYIRMQMDPNTAHTDIEHAIKDFGYNRLKHGAFPYWILNCVGNLIRAFERGQSLTVEDYWKDLYTSRNGDMA